MDRALQGKAPREGGEGTELCSIFDSGLVPKLFAVDASQVRYRRSVPVKRAGHVLCLAAWDNPNKAELDKAYKAELMEWARSVGKPNRAPQPKPPKNTSQVSLTILGDSFNSADEAAADLESKVATLSEGVSVTVGGKVHETRMMFGDWIGGVGDKAIFSDKGGLMVAAHGKQFTVKVSAMETPEKNQEKAVELARHVIPQL